MTVRTSPAESDEGSVIAVVGATGQQGGATARALLAAGARVRGLTRSADSAAAQALARAGAQVVEADLDDPESVRAAFSGADRVFAMTTMVGESGTAGEIQHGRTIADAALATGITHLVYSSVGGAERRTGIPHFESKRQVEEYIADLGVPATVVRPVFFMENLLGATVEDGQVVVRLPLPDGVPLQMIAVEDLGTAVAAVLLDPDRVGASVEIGADELTGSQIAEVFGRQAGLPARYEALPTAVLQDDDMRAMFEWFAGPVAYQADRELTRALAPELMDTAAWLATTHWPR